MPTAREIISSSFNGSMETAFTTIHNQGSVIDDETIEENLTPFTFLSNVNHIKYALDESVFKEDFRRVCKQNAEKIFEVGSQCGPAMIKYLSEESVLRPYFDINQQIRWTLSGNPYRIYQFTKNCPLTLKYLLFESIDKEKIRLTEDMAIDISRVAQKQVEENQALNPQLYSTYAKLTTRDIDENTPVENYLHGRYSYSYDGSFTEVSLLANGTVDYSSGSGGALGSECSDSKGTWKVESVDKQKHIATVKFTFGNTSSYTEVGFNSTTSDSSNEVSFKTVNIHYAKKPKELHTSYEVCKEETRY
jgi:hypothetical protein